MSNKFDIVMVWYQNDWGLYGRRNEMLARALAGHPQIRKLVHIEPPIDIENLKNKLESNTFDDNIEVNLKRIRKDTVDKVITFTPHVPGGLTDHKNRKIIQEQLRELIDSEGLENLILWLYPPHVFSAMVIKELGGQARLVVSDCVDDHRKYTRTEKERSIVQKRYESLLKYSDIVFSVSGDFSKDFQLLNKNIHHIPNAAGTAEFEKNPHYIERPADMEHINHPIVGYTGALSFRIDCRLLENIAIQKPDWNIVLIGTSPSKKLRYISNKYKNIHILGPKKYTDIGSYLNCFDVSIIPHFVDDTTACMNPLKLFEYLRHGKPVVTTGVAGVETFGDVIEIADNREDYIAAIEKCLQHESGKRIKKRMDAVKHHTWENRVNSMMGLINTAYAEKQSLKTATPDYYQYSRPEIQALVPFSAKKILDVGCATGVLGKALKDRQECEVTGIEYVPEIAEKAKAVLDKVLTGDIEEIIQGLPTWYFDCIIFADVLEHLREPGNILSKLKQCIASDGIVIASIPNVRHWSVLKDLLEGRWDYADAGILDRTHLRFFTKSSLVKMFRNAGFSPKIKTGTKIQGLGVPEKVVTALGSSGIDVYSLLEEGEIYQYLLTAKPHKYISAGLVKTNLTSIIVLAHNQLEYTKMCIESIVKYTKEPFELILVDNASTDGTAEYLDSELLQLIPKGKLQIIRNKKNLGFAEGNNRGMAVAGGDYIILLNNDVVVTPGWIGRLKTCAEKKSDIGIVGPVSNFVVGPQLVEAVPYNLVSLEGLNEFAEKRGKEYAGQTKRLARVVGFCMLIKREVVEKIGGLDSRYGLGNFEDDDFSLRTILAGYGSCIAKDCFIHHFGNRTFVGANINYHESLENNWKLFKEKWELAEELPYGSYFSIPNLLKGGFIPEKHFCSLGQANSLETDPVDVSSKLSDGGSIEDQYEMAQQLVSEGKHVEAVRRLERLLEMSPDFAIAHNDLGVLYYKQGAQEKALNHYELAVRIEPHNLNFQKNLADFYFVESGRIQDALTIYNEVLEVDPGDAESLMSMGLICAALERPEDARHFYNRVLENQPWNLDARQRLENL